MRSVLHAKPPPVLALHLNRSVHFGAYAAKNSARVHFPEVLDLMPFTTSGMLSTSPSFPLSSHMSFPSAAASLASLTSKAQNSAPQPPRVLYCLAAVVCHYGQHSFGHYVCFRRKPRGFGRVALPRLDELPTPPGRGWLRVSDNTVREVGIETVLQEGSGAFMLYYELARSGERRPVWSLRGGAIDDINVGGTGDCEKKTQTLHLNDAPRWESTEEEEKEAPVIKARIVRSVSLARDEDDNGIEGPQVKQERNPDSEARLLSSPIPTKLQPVEVELPSAVSAEAPPPIPDTPATVDEPPKAVP
jgi:hypothetical protein